jgi:hypothetical protein
MTKKKLSTFITGKQANAATSHLMLHLSAPMKTVIFEDIFKMRFGLFSP